MLLFAVVAMMSMVVVGCSDDDDNNIENLPVEVQKAFSQKYPNANFEDWEQKSGYYVIDFKQNGVESEAWFQSGRWVMTETDITYQQLPQAVQASFKAGKYAEWRVDDVDMIERYGMQTVFVVEVEQGKAEMDLYYFEDGSLFKEVTDMDEDDSYLPEVPTNVTNKINEMYPGAVVLDIEMEHGMYEVEIRHEGIEKEVVFGRDFQWVSTSWDVMESQLPDAVKNFIAANYAGYKIDDVEFYSTPKGTYYEIELEMGVNEIKVNVTPEGEIFK